MIKKSRLRMASRLAVVTFTFLGLSTFYNNCSGPNSAVRQPSMDGGSAFMSMEEKVALNTVGYKNAPGYPGSLTNFTGSLQSGQTYRFMNFPNGLYIPASVNNVTFYGCRFASNAVDDANVAIYGDYVSFEYSTFEPSAVSAPPTSYSRGYQYGIDQRSDSKITIDHSDFWGWGNGIQFRYSSAAKPFVVTNSHFHDARDDGGIDHTDAILENYGGVSHMVFDNNIIVSKGNTNGLALQNGNKRGYQNVTITNNYFSGFGYTLNICGYFEGCSNIKFEGNTYGTDIKPVWGPLYSWNSGNGNTWKCNRWRVAPGGYSNNTADDGKYWLSSGNLSTTDSACTSGPVGPVEPTPDTAAPSVPASLTASSSSSSQITVSWSASTDNVAVTAYELQSCRGASCTNFAALSTLSGRSYVHSGLVANSDYRYRVRARDAANNMSAFSSVVSATTQAVPVADTTAPSVSINSPTANAAVSGSVAISATASDNVGVVGVQFRINGANVGAEDTSAPYSISIDSKTLSNGSHVLTAVARDAAGNVRTSSSVSINVNNVAAAAEQSLFTNQVPAQLNLTDGSNVNYELGMRFTATTAGKIKSIRFYKASSETGTHTGRIFSAAGVQLSSVTFSSETASDWQRQDLAAPLSISANTEYVVTVNTGRTYYVASNDGLARQISNGSLRSVVGNNGVYGSVGAFPRSSYRASNYFRDVVFTPDSVTPPPPPPPADTTKPSVSITAPAANATVSGVISVSASASDNVGVSGVQFLLNNAALSAEDVSAPYSVSLDTTTLVNGVHSLSARARDAAGNTQLVSISVTVSNSVVVIPNYCTTGGAMLWSNLDKCGYPSATTSGVPAGRVLTATSGRTITRDGTIVDGERITGALIINAKNVIVRNSMITSSFGTGQAVNATGVIKIQPGASVTIENCTLNGSNRTHAAIWYEGSNLVARKNNIYGVNDGIFVWDANNFTIEDNYLHDFTTEASNGHVDGFQTEGASNGIIRHNVFDVAQGQTSAISVWNGRRSSDNILIEKNLISGGGFAVYVQDYSPSEANPAGGNSVTNVRLVDNKFSNVRYKCVGNWGIWYTRGAPTDGWNRSGNVVLETAQNVDNRNPIVNGVECR